MAKLTLRQLYEQHEGKLTDKWASYLAEYDRLFLEYRDRPVRLLEIGIQNGGSAEIWSKYFELAQCIVGCDINPDCAKLVYSDSRISIVVADANSDQSEQTIASISPQYDLIIDDGSHVSGDIIRSFARYFPHLADGGLYVVEDLHCSYWAEWQGGLFDPASSIAFFKRLVDVISHEHWGVSTARKDILESFARKYKFDIDEELLAQIHSVEFINSICVIRKSIPAVNALGARFMAGSEEIVASGHKPLHMTPNSVSDERLNQWSGEQLPEDEFERIKAELLRLKPYQLQLASLNQAMVERDAQLANLNQAMVERDVQIAKLNQVLVEVRESTSWRLTTPVRLMGRQLLRIKLIFRALPYARAQCGGYRGVFKRMWKVFQAEGMRGIKRRIAVFVSSRAPHLMFADEGANLNDYAEWIQRYDTLDDAKRGHLRAQISAMPIHPIISVVMPCYNPKLEWLRAAIESVRAQLYPYWELCIADDASTDPGVRHVLESYQKSDARIKVAFREQNGHISAASNSALEVVTGDYVALLDQDDLLAEHALFCVADCILQNPDSKLIYSDEDKIDESGHRRDPYFKCEFNYELLLAQNTISHLGVYKTAMLRDIGGFRLGLEGSQDWDVALRCIERLKPNEIVHIPRVLYHWRMHEHSTASKGQEAKPYAYVAAEKALNAHFERKGVAAQAQLIAAIGQFRVHYALPERLPLVTLIIPTRNGLSLLRKCINSILDKTEYRNYEIIIVDNGSDDPATLAYFETLGRQAHIQILRDDGPFNYSALNNRAVQLARGEFVCLINNDIEVITDGWLSEMISLALQPGVGAVGARLWYPNETLQHAGVITGIGGIASHVHSYQPRGYCGYFGRSALTQSFSAVTGACLLVSKSIYDEVNGLDQDNLAIAYNDVDFCLRLREAGYRNVWTPYAELYHHESATRGNDDTPEKKSRLQNEMLHMKDRWGDALLKDPAYSPNLTLDRDDFSYAWPPRVPPIESMGAKYA